ncbi:hypothetical protein JTS96_07305 [Clostridium botulinum]|nr:hypothetical protein [Clostridium botulinum]
MEGIMESIKNSKDAFIIAEIGVNYYDIAKKKYNCIRGCKVNDKRS